MNILKKKLMVAYRSNIKLAIILLVIIPLTSLGGLYSNNMNPIKHQKHKVITNMKRYGNIIKVKPEKLDYYKKLHAEPWPEVIKAINECNVRNFSIYYRDGYLFSYYEYVGEDYDADMKKMSEHTSHWLKEIEPCQEPIETAKEGEWWAGMQEVFHTD